MKLASISLLCCSCDWECMRYGLSIAYCWKKGKVGEVVLMAQLASSEADTTPPQGDRKGLQGTSPLGVKRSGHNPSPGRPQGSPLRSTPPTPWGGVDGPIGVK